MGSQVMTGTGALCGTPQPTSIALDGGKTGRGRGIGARFEPPLPSAPGEPGDTAYASLPGEEFTFCDLREERIQT